MATKRTEGGWTFSRKFRQWRAEHKVSLSGFAKRIGVPYATLYGWAERDTRVPADGMAKIAVATKLPADYWTRPDVPYPPPRDYLGLADRIMAAMLSLSAETMQQIAEMFADRADLERTLALRRAARR